MPYLVDLSEGHTTTDNFVQFSAPEVQSGRSHLADLLAHTED